MTREEVVQHLTPPPGITMPPYPAKRDKIYRLSLVLMGTGLIFEGISGMARLASIQFWIQGAISAVLIVSGWTFLVWLKQWRWTVRTMVVLGFVLWPVWPLGGWALSLAAGAIMAAKETHCFHFWAGRVIPWYTLILGVLLIIHLSEPFMGVAWLGLAALWISLAAGRSKLPLFEI
jgi:hypothetical protein